MVFYDICNLQNNESIYQGNTTKVVNKSIHVTHHSIVHRIKIYKIFAACFILIKVSKVQLATQRSDSLNKGKVSLKLKSFINFNL